MKTVSLKIDEHLYDRIESAAAERGHSRSFIVREAVALYLAGDSAHGESCLDRAGALIGTLDGPADLSAGKGYLAGYGE